MRSLSLSLIAVVAVSASQPGLLFPPPVSRELRARQTNSSAISWKACLNGDLQCGTLAVPLDYSNPSAGDAILAVVMLPATQTNKLGALFLNPGGPGGSGVSLMEDGATIFQNYTGGYYDIVSWDPRGINYTTPLIKCFTSAALENQFLSGNPIELEMGSTLTNTDITTIKSQVSSLDNILQTFYSSCSATDGDNLKYVGTAANARDLVELSDAIQGAGEPVNYWGFSYGTAIGSYFVNMFPDRVGRVILDGVVNPQVWAQELSYHQASDNVENADEAYTAFISTCVAAGTKCSIGGGMTESTLRTALDGVFDDLYEAYPKGFQYGTQILRSVVRSYLYTPRAWDDLADLFLQFRTQLNRFNTSFKFKRGPADFVADIKFPKLSDFPKDIATQFPPDIVRTLRALEAGVGGLEKRQQQDEDNGWSYFAISCGDALDNDGTATTSVVVDDIISTTQNISPMFGLSFGSGGQYCHRWNSRAVERYQGPWDATLGNKILVIGNQADPVTPLRSAQFVFNQLNSNGRTQAYLVEQEGAGHTSHAELSDCTTKAIADYLIGGTVPSSTTTSCQVNQDLYGGSTPEESDIDLISSVAPVEPTAGQGASGTGASGALATGGSSSSNNGAMDRISSAHGGLIALVAAITLSLL